MLPEYKIEIFEQYKKFLSKKGWSFRENETGDLYFYKKRFPDFVDFRSFSKSKYPLSIFEISQKSIDFFKNANYDRVVMNSVLNDTPGDTFFIVAGTQYLTKNSLFNSPSRLFSLQPVVRTKFRKKIKDGTLSTFINMANMCPSTSIEEHLDELDKSFDFLSACKLYVNDLTLVLKRNYGAHKGNWSKTDGVVLKLFYGNLEIGDAGLISFDDSSCLLSDRGLGLERLVWAQYKENFKDVVGPLPDARFIDLDLMDSIRSITLLSASEVSDGTIDQKRQFYQYINKLPIAIPNLSALSKYYYDFWSFYIKLNNSFDRTFEFIDDSIQRMKFLKLNKKLDLKNKSDDFSNLDNYIKNLITKKIIKPSDLRRLN